MTVKFVNGIVPVTNATGWLRDWGRSALRGAYRMVTRANWGVGGVGNVLKYLVLSNDNDPQMPSVITADLNQPSFLDHTALTAKDEALASARHAPVYSFNWPGSRSMDKEGFHDSFRRLHPWAWPSASSGRAAPPELYGFTWHHDAPSGLVADRVDYVYYRDGVVNDYRYAFRPTLSVVAHSDSCTFRKTQHANPGANANAPTPSPDPSPPPHTIWPSDHNAVFTAFMLDKLM